MNGIFVEETIITWLNEKSRKIIKNKVEQINNGSVLNLDHPTKLKCNESTLTKNN